MQKTPTIGGCNPHVVKVLYSPLFIVLFPFLLTLCTQRIHAQNTPAPGSDIKVAGRVTGGSGEPVAGASVQVKGTSRGTTTDFNGNFALSAPSNATLEITSIGFQTQEISVGGQTSLDIKLTPGTKMLDEVVVVGYGVQKKIDVTGAVSTIKGEDIAKQASPNAISALQGKVAGVDITNSGQPGVAPTVLIRGLGTYYAQTGPLYVVDGTWVSDITWLNPADVESMSILKDASSTAIYGINGANGVVVIATRKGSKVGKVNVTYSGDIGWQKITNKVKMADGYQYAVLFNELERESSPNPVQLDSSQFGEGTNWYNQTLRNALVTNHQISVSGGSDKNQFNFSLGYLYQEGGLKTNDYQRYTANLSDDISVTKNIKVGYTAIGTYGLSDDPPGGIWHDIYSAPPIIPVRFAQGNYGDPGYYGLGSSVDNPQATLDYNNSHSKDASVQGGGYLDIKFLRHFTYHGYVGGQWIDNRSKVYTPVYDATSTQNNAVSNLSTTEYETRRWIIENTLTYDKKFEGGHSLTALIGQHADYFNYDEIHASAINVPDYSSGSWYLGLGSSANVYDVDPNQYNPAYPLLSTVASYFGRVQYSYQDKYSVNATIRADGSSKFIGSSRWGYFPSVGAAWVVSKEKFMEHQHIFNSLKLKGSWGQVGNVGIPTYISQQTGVSGGAYSVIYGNTGVISPGVSVASITPAQVVWEKGEGTDIGLEATFLDDRLSLEADYYNKDTKNFIFEVNLPGSVGASSPYIIENVGDIRNRGFELTLGWKDKVGKDFHYSIDANMAYNTNVVLSNSAGGQKIYNGGEGATSGTFTTVTTKGEPIGEFYGYKVTGIFQTPQDVTNYVDKGGNEYQPNAQPGDFKYASTTGVGPISGNDRVYLGNPNPKYVYGINTNFGYKNWDLGLAFNGVADVSVYNANLGLRYGAENYTQDFYNHRWHGVGTSNTYPSANIGGNQNYNPNSFYVESGSYFRIRDMQLGYTFSKEMINREWVQRIRVYADLQNPFNFFSYKGFTPEVGGTPGNAGIDTNVYPLFATYRFGATLTF